MCPTLLLERPAAPRSDLTRRQALGGLGGLAVAGLLSACGGDEATPAGSTTRSVTHALGTTDVPVEPQRIAVVGRRGTLAILLDLGLEPVGALDASFVLGQPFHPLIEDAAADVEPIALLETGPDVEQVAALRPDLIIGASVDFLDVADQLSAIAPTVGIEWDFVDPLANVRAVGEAVGLGAEAEALAADFDQAVDDLAATLGDVGTVSIAGFFAPDDLRIYRAESVVGQIVERLGGVVTPSEEELPSDPEDPVLTSISLEQVGLLNGERLISFVNLDPESDGLYRDLITRPLIAGLPSVSSGAVLELDPQTTFGTAGVAGLRVALGQIGDFLAG